MASISTISMQNAFSEVASENITLKTAKGRKLPQYIAALAASFSAFLMGTVMGWTTQISPKILNGELGFPINEDELGWIGSIIMLGAALLSLLVGPVCDLIGKKAIMLILIAPLTLGWSLICWATNVEMVYAGRFFTGMVGGAYCAMAPIYCNEISQKGIRGSLGSFTQLMVALGILFDTIVSKYASIQHFSICCLAAPFLFGITFAFMPETPVYFLKKKKFKEAKSALKRLRGDKYDVDGEILEINATVTKTKSINAVQILLTSFKRPQSRRAFVICMGLMSFRILTGIDAINAYTSYIFASVSNDLDPELAPIISMAVEVLAVIAQAFVVNRLGRRLLLLTSEIVIAICLIIIGLCASLKEKIGSEYSAYIDYIPLVALCMFHVGFSLGLGPLSLMMVSEVLPRDIVSLIGTFSFFVSWMLAFVVRKTFIIMQDAWGTDVTFFIYGGLSIAGLVFVFFLVPETRGKSYNEIQALLGSR